MVVGWCRLTPPEWGILIVIAALVVWGGIPHYTEWRQARIADEEQIVVMSVRAALFELRNRSTVVDHGNSLAALDTCRDGSSQDCVLFGVVLPNQTRSPGWTKRNGSYVGPTGTTYIYDRSAWEFTRIESPAVE
jgi:hypothetical protein